MPSCLKGLVFIKQTTVANRTKKRRPLINPRRRNLAHQKKMLDPSRPKAIQTPQQSDPSHGMTCLPSQDRTTQRSKSQCHTAQSVTQVFTFGLFPVVPPQQQHLFAANAVRILTSGGGWTSLIACQTRLRRVIMMTTAKVTQRIIKKVDYAGGPGVW